MDVNYLYLLSLKVRQNMHVFTFNVCRVTLLKREHQMI